MTPFEAYSFLFADAFMEGIALPIHRAYVHQVMMLFGGYNNWLIWLLSGLGAGSGYSLNWLLGKLLRSWKKTEISQESGSVEKGKKFIRNYIRFLLPFTWVSPPLGGLLTLASGMLRIPLWQHVALVMIGNLAGFGIVVYIN